MGLAQERDLEGISIIGNREQPMSMIIVPWKTPELGEQLELPQDTVMKDVLAPISKQLLLKEIEIYNVVTD